MKKPRSTTRRGRDARPAEPLEHADGWTDRPETPALEGREPLPQELTGRASGTDDSLVALFDSSSPEHLTDGFRGGTQDVPGDTDSGSPPHPVEPEGTRD